MAKATPHGPGEIDSTSLIGWYAFLYPLSVRTALRKKEDRSILQRIDLSLSGARHHTKSHHEKQVISGRQDAPSRRWVAFPRIARDRNVVKAHASVHAPHKRSCPDALGKHGELRRVVGLLLPQRVNDGKQSLARLLRVHHA